MNAAELSFAQLILEAKSADEAASIFIQGCSQLAPFVQGACLISPLIGPARVLAVSHVADLEQSGPYAVWLRKLSAKIHRANISGPVPAHFLQGAHNPEKFSPAQMIFLPFELRSGEKGAFFFMRAEPWSEADMARLQAPLPLIITRLGFLRRPEWAFLKHKPQRKTYAILGILILLMLFPVRHSSVAPVEIVPVKPTIIASGIPGVVRSLHVTANESVHPGQILVTLDDLDQKSKLAIARRDLNVTEAELRRLQQMGFLDPSQRYRLAELEGQLRIRQLEVERAEAELERTIIRAERDGVAVSGDPLEWQGRPVQIGERIMQIADPKQTAARILVPVADGPVLSTQTRGKIYLDSEPWRGHAIEIRSWLFEPELTPGGTFAYRAQADWAEDVSEVRIGMRGTAHLDGHYTPLILHLLRRPIILLRQVTSL
jgi:Biotin-lipoyl like/HlyD family secretion protein